jgi:hypothetical protein
MVQPRWPPFVLSLSRAVVATPADDNTMLLAASRLLTPWRRGPRVVDRAAGIAAPEPICEPVNLF